MILELCSYSRSDGWSGKFPTALDSPQTLLLLFADAALLEKGQLQEEIGKAFPQAVLIGCSTISPIANGQIVYHGAVLAICQFEKSTLKTAMQSLQTPAESRQAGETVGKALYRPDLRQVLLFGDDQVLNANEFMNGLNSAAPQPVQISGGMASHPDFADGTRLLVLGRQVKSQAVGAVGIYGEMLHAAQVEDVGLMTHSKFYTITQAENRVIYEVDKRPALEIYREFLGVLAPHLEFMHVFPVGFYAQPLAPLKVVRSVLGVDEKQKALIFASDLPAEKTIRFMVGLPTQFVDSAKRVASQVSEQMGQKQRLLALTVSCASREFALGDDVDKEPAAVYNHLPPNTTQIGFYAYGEIAWGGTGTCELHNHTINVTLLGE